MAVNPSIQLGTSGNWAIKEDNLLAYKQLGNKFFDREFDFSRGTRATFVGRNGLIQESGLTDTELVNASTNNLSGWIDARSSANLSIVNNNIRATRVSGSKTGVSTAITTVVGKTYLVKVNGTRNNTSGVFLARVTNDSTLGAVGSVIFELQSANNSISADGTFVATQTTHYVGILATSQGTNDYIQASLVSVKEIELDVPRIDFTDDTTGHLLLEPQSTNRITQSEDFTTGWNNLINGSGINPVVTSNQGTSPDGTLNADRVVFDLNGGTSASDYSLLNYSLSGFSNPHTLDTSIYLKSSDNNDYQVAIYNRGTSIQIITVTNKWQRFSVNGTRSNTTNNFRIGLFGDTSSNTASLLLFGSQAEEGSFATSYIPTSGSMVTRNQESCNNSGTINDFNSEEGVLYAEIAALADDLTNRVISLSDGTTNERVVLMYLNSTNTIRCFIKSAGSFVASLNKVVSNEKEFHKIAYRYKSGETKLFVDGLLIATSTNTFSITGLDVLQFSNGVTTSQRFFGKTKNVKVFKRALTDAELQELTT